MANLFRSALALALGVLLGAISWLAALLSSGSFEPYDGSLGLLVNQLVTPLPAPSRNKEVES